MTVPAGLRFKGDLNLVPDFPIYDRRMLAVINLVFMANAACVKRVCQYLVDVSPTKVMASNLHS